MKLSNYLYLLTYMTIINAQDDNPSGHEAVGLPVPGVGVGLPGTLTSTTTSTSTTLTSTMSTTSTSVPVSSGNKNVLNYGFLLCAFLLL